MMGTSGNSSEFYSFPNESLTDMDDGDISKKQVRVMLLVSGIILIPLFCLLGSVGNILSLCVLFHQRMRNQVNYVLAALCISDTLFLIHCLIYTGLNVYRKLQPENGESLRAHIYPIIGAYGSVVTARITSCLTFLLCAQRFIAVYFPLRAKEICSNRNTCLSVGCIYVITIALFVPLSLKYEAKEVKLNITTNTHKTIIATTDFFNNNVNFYKIYGTFLNIVFRFAPLALIPILNILMIRILHMNWKKRRGMSEPDRESNHKLTQKVRKPSPSNGQSRITVMLLTVSFIFFICILPGALNSIASSIYPEYSPLGKKKNMFTFVAAITFLLETINSSVNFIIYMGMSRKFRLLYKEIFCCGHGKYLRKISISSIRERIRSSTRKRSSKKGKQAGITRRAYSDLGIFGKNSNSDNKYVRYGQLTEGCEPVTNPVNGRSRSCDLNLFLPKGMLSLRESNLNGNHCENSRQSMYSQMDNTNCAVVRHSKSHIFTRDLQKSARDHV